MVGAQTLGIPHWEQGSQHLERLYKQRVGPREKAPGQAEEEYVDQSKIPRRICIAAFERCLMSWDSINSLKKVAYS